MKYSVFAYSRKGCETAERVLKTLEGQEAAAWCPARLLDDSEEGRRLGKRFSPIPKLFRPFYGERFADADVLIFVGACGIAVREIAPFVKSKKTDPAVLCVDDHARFVIPVLSGHIGGANEQAAILAQKLQATPVITTATDISSRFSVDTWAAGNGLVIDSMKAAKDVSAAILERDLPVCTDLSVEGALPNGIFAWDPKDSQEAFPLGIYIGWKTKKPFEETLRLIPKDLIVGIGCRKGTKKEEIRSAVTQVFSENELDLRAVAGAASIDLKSEEEGLLSWCAEQKLDIRFYSAEELQAAEGSFASSDFVKSITGVDNVCERSALIGAGDLIVKKTKKDKVTVAVVARRRVLAFT